MVYGKDQYWNERLKETSRGGRKPRKSKVKPKPARRTTATHIIRLKDILMGRYLSLTEAFNSWPAYNDRITYGQLVSIPRGASLPADRGIRGGQSTQYAGLWGGHLVLTLLHPDYADNLLKMKYTFSQVDWVKPVTHQTHKGGEAYRIYVPQFLWHQVGFEAVSYCHEVIVLPLTLEKEGDSIRPREIDPVADEYNFIMAIFV